MATIQTTAKTVTTNQALKFVDAVCDTYGYQATISNPAYEVVDGVPNGQPETIPNPVSKAQFAQHKLDDFALTWARNIIIDYNRRQIVVDTNTGL